MLAARVHAWGEPPVLEEVAEPVPGEGESLVEVAAAAVGHLDLTVAGGRFAHRPPLPYVPGTDGAGRVVRSPALPAGTAVRIRGGGAGLTRDGTWAERAALPQEALHALPDGVDLTVAAVFFSPCLTAHLAVHEVGAVAAGERVVVTGAAGAVGSIAVQLALRAGAERVVGVVRRPEKRTAVADGAEAVVAGDGALADRGPFDVAVDTVGGPPLLGLLPAMRRGGRIVLVGYTAGREVAFDLPALLAAEVRLLPVSLLNHASALGDVAARMLQRLRAGELVVPVTPFPLARVAEAVETLRAGTAVGRVAVIPGRSADA